MERNLIIFDMDDVMWDLNGKAAGMAAIDRNKLTVFSAYDNRNLTDGERERLLAAYAGMELYRDIRFDSAIVGLINSIYREYPRYRIQISSNCASRAIRDIKMPQLLNVLDLPEADIFLNVIDIVTQSTQKSLPKGIFLFVDDSPHNIALADAVHKIMPARTYNDVLEDGRLNGCRVDRPEDDEALIRLVMDYIKKGGSS